MAVTVIGSAGAALLTVAVLTGCGGESAMNAEEAKTSVVTFVDDSASAVGDSWEVESGPGLGKCDLGLPGDGVSTVYITVRSAGEDPAADVAAVERHWKNEGVTTERYESGGADPILGVRGTGGPVKSSDFRADARGYSIEGESPCAAGDFDEISRDSQE